MSTKAIEHALEARPVRSLDQQQPAHVQRRLSQRGRRSLWRLGPNGWWIVDVVLAFLSVIVAFFITPHADTVWLRESNHVGIFHCAIAYAVLLGVFSHVAGLQDPRYHRRFLDLVGRCITVAGLSLTVLTFELIIVHYLRMGRYILFLTAGLSVTSMVSLRLLAAYFSRNFAYSVCFLGGDNFCFHAAQLFDEHQLPFKVQTVLDDEHHRERGNLPEWVSEQQIDEVVYDESADTNDNEALLRCLGYGIKVSSYADFVESNFYLVPVEHIDATWLFSARIDLSHPYYYGLKRLVDIVLSTVGLIVTAPLTLLAMLMIKLESRGPVLYSQTRVGRFNRPFRIFKLRTMVQDAEKDGAQWAATGDARITRVGNFLRRTRLDEVPQFWNVLKGEMSLVGPRPERPEFVSTLSQEIPFYGQRHLVKPGLTGWAQINYPYGASVEDSLNKLAYDLYYVKCASIGLDLQILLRTVGALMKGSR